MKTVASATLGDDREAAELRYKHWAAEEAAARLEVSRASRALTKAEEHIRRASQETKKALEELLRLENGGT